MLVLDASGSMWGQLQGRTKIEIARATVAGLVRDWKAGNALGLVAYGHRRKGDCADIETLIAAGPLDASAYLATVNALNPRGMTPLSAAVVQAAEALKSSEQKATVILVSDGEETCDLDPCEVGRRLEQSGVDFTAHVIGFDVANPAHQAQLRCLAENTGGRYFNASDAQGLAVALDSVVAMSTEPPLPPASATLTAPSEASVSSRIEVRWQGPGDAGDYIAFVDPANPNQAELRYTWVRHDESDVADPTQPLSIKTPAEPGDYRLRYVSPRRKAPVLAEIPFTALKAEAYVRGPAEAASGGMIEVEASGPVDAGHWIGFAPAGSEAGSYRDYVRPEAGVTRYRLRTPGEPGEYELRYVLDESAAIAASQPIRIVAAQARISGPAEAQAGSTIQVEASGPVESGHWIGFAPAGSDAGSYLDYTRPEPGVSRYELSTPAEPGEYELRYVINESEAVIAAQPIRITALQGSLEAPAEVGASATLTVRVTAPWSDGQWIGIAPAGSPDGEYATWSGLERDQTGVELVAPEAPGDYEIRLHLGSGGPVALRRPLRVLPAE